jgi:hypothetical protein
LSHTTTQLLNSFNNYSYKIILLNILTMFLATLFEHYTHSERSEESLYT